MLGQSQYKLKFIRFWQTIFLELWLNTFTLPAKRSENSRSSPLVGDGEEEILTRESYEKTFQGDENCLFIDLVSVYIGVHLTKIHQGLKQLLKTKTIIKRFIKGAPEWLGR